MLIVKLRIDSFIVTLSMMFIFMGLRSGISGGQPYPVPTSFGIVGQKGILGGGIIYTLIRHGLIEMKANPYYMNVYIGILILLTIAIDRVRERYDER